MGKTVHVIGLVKYSRSYYIKHVIASHDLLNEAGWKRPVVTSTRANRSNVEKIDVIVVYQERFVRYQHHPQNDDMYVIGDGNKNIKVYKVYEGVTQGVEVFYDPQVVLAFTPTCGCQSCQVRLATSFMFLGGDEVGLEVWRLNTLFAVSAASIIGGTVTTCPLSVITLECKDAVRRSVSDPNSIMGSRMRERDKFSAWVNAGAGNMAIALEKRCPFLRKLIAVELLQQVSWEEFVGIVQEEGNEKQS